MVATNNCIHTSILCKYYVTMSQCKYYVTKFCVQVLVNTCGGLTFQKHFKAGPCDSPKYEVLDIHSFSTDTHMQKQTMLISSYQ